MGNIAFDYAKVDSQTKAIKSSAKENLKTYANTKYDKLKEAMDTSKGDYQTYLVTELSAENKVVEAAADFIIRLQNMMKATADDFKATDASYQTGAVISGK